MSVNLQELKDEELYMMLSGDKRKARIAFDELYNRYSDRIFTYCRKYIQNDSVAEDVFQEVFIRLHTSSQKNVVIKNIGGFLITVARNLCHNEVNRKNYNFSDLKEINLMFYDFPLENKEIKNIVNLAIDSLPEQYKEIIIMKENMDMSYNEIAKVLDLSLSAVRIRIFRAKEKLKNILTPYLKDLQG